MANELELKTGDIVELLSGGPAMTVLYPEYGNDNGCHCGWFKTDGTYTTHTFLKQTIKKTTPKKPYTGL
jgi:uncharacterized protein YodC (DUF2158 family)